MTTGNDFLDAVLGAMIGSIIGVTLDAIFVASFKSVICQNSDKK